MNDSPLTRIGLLGGTFNPIHNGHLSLAKHARQALALDQVIFIPSGDPPHKAGASLAPAHRRLAMVRHAVAGIPRYAVSDVEAAAAETSYTIDTIQTLRTAWQGEFWFIVGLDAFIQMASWKSVETVLSLTNVLVLSRPHVQFSQAASLAFLPPLPPGHLQRLDAGTRRRVDLPIGPHTTVTFLRTTPCQVSASAVRERIRQGLDVADWLPPQVHSYIIRHHLYEQR